MTGPTSWLAPARAAVGAGPDAPAALLGEGQMCVAVLVGDTDVVRFPRHALGRTHLGAERRVVPVLGPHLPHVALPVPGAADLGDDAARPFAVHRLVPGTLVTESLVQRLAPPDRAALADALAGLLAGLTAATSDARDGGLPTTPLTQVASDLQGDVDRLLAPHMTGPTAARVRRSLQDLAAVTPVDGVLCHADLGGNLLWDAEHQRLGVIDLDTMTISDPVLDLASLSVLGPVLMELLAARVPAAHGRQTDIDRVRATFALQEAVLSAQQGDLTNVDRVLATL